MTTSVRDVLNQAYRYLTGMQSEQRNQLADGIDSTTTTLTLTHDLAGAQPGSYLSIDLELLYIWSVNVANKTVEVLRGDLGSSPASHADGAVVYVNPKFSYFQMFMELNNDLAALSSPDNGLFCVKTKTFTATTANAYDFEDTTAIEIIDVRVDSLGADSNMKRLRNWEFVPKSNTTMFPSGYELQVLDDNLTLGAQFVVRYKAEFGQVTGLNDTLESVGFPSQASDIPPLGIAADLMVVREMKRSFLEAQEDPRRATEVPPGAAASAARAMSAQRQKRIQEEARRLSLLYPVFRR